MAYFWYDISAAMHARIIAEKGYAETNQYEIDARDAMGAHLTPEALRFVQADSILWQASFLR